MSTKRCMGFILFCLYLVINKTSLCECVEPRYFLILANKSSSKQNKKSPTHPFVDIGKWGTCQKFQQKLLVVVVGARKSFQFFRQNAWFFKNNRALSKFLYGILHYLVKINKL